MDEEAFEGLWNAHYGDILAFCLRRLGNRQEAADATADAFLVAWRRSEEIPENARPWLYGVALKVVANRRRGERRRSALTEKLGRAAGEALGIGTNGPGIGQDGPGVGQDGPGVGQDGPGVGQYASGAGPFVAPAAEQLDDVLAAFRSLSVGDQEVLSLVAWEELAPAEAAQVLGIPAARFSVRLHRARRRLRNRLASAELHRTNDPITETR
jgi:RNA polymerase sigma factor (sigma-70 family)